MRLVDLWGKDTANKWNGRWGNTKNLAVSAIVANFASQATVWQARLLTTDGFSSISDTN